MERDGKFEKPEYQKSAVKQSLHGKTRKGHLQSFPLTLSGKARGHWAQGKGSQTVGSHESVSAQTQPCFGPA